MASKLRDASAARALHKPDLSLRHLEAELARIDILLRREVRRWILANQDPADIFRGLYVSNAQAEALLARPLGASWGHAVMLSAPEARVAAEAQASAERDVERVTEIARRQGQTLRLDTLAAAFGLDRFEIDTLLICLAPALDLRYERLYGYLQDNLNRRRPGLNLVLDLLCEPGSDRLAMLCHFSDEAPLFKHHILGRVVEPGWTGPPLLAQTLTIDPTIVSWLLGDYQPGPDLAGHAVVVPPQADEADVLLAGETSRRNVLLRNSLGAGQKGRLPPSEAPPWREVATGREPPIVVFHGPDRLAQGAAARLLAARAGRPLLSVDLAAVTEDEMSSLRTLRLALRDTRLTGAIPFLSGWDACLEDGAPSPDLLAELYAYPALAVVAGQACWQPRGIARDREFLWLEFPLAAYPQRLALWRHFLNKASPLSVESLEECIKALAGQFALSTDQICDAVASARDRATGRGSPLEEEDLLAAARAHSNPRLSSLARQITPRYGWQDIVLPDDQLALLHEIVATVRQRPRVLDEWGVGKKLASSSGVTILFAGPPGTGKTMAAEVIAAELGLDLYKIDLSTIVSKYIGETEKNLERIFSEAENSNAILFFDEADALFGKRSEVRDSHDRYANIEISYLLQRMETYSGISILATNLKGNLDEAFTRRLQFAVNFPFPEEEDRLRIWQTLFPPGVPRDPALDLGLLARRFKLAGGNIRNILVNAAYLAADDGCSITMEHLLHGTHRELQKMGWLVSEEDLTVERST